MRARHQVDKTARNNTQHTHGGMATWRWRASIAGVAVGAVAVAVGISTSASASPKKDDNIRICHATSSETNPYTHPTVDPAGAYDGHLGHKGPVWYPGAKAAGVDWGDIIPPFTYNNTTYSLNWDAAGQAIWNNGCEVPGEPTTPPATETTTPPSTETTDTTPPETETTTVVTTPPETETTTVVTTPPDTETTTVVTTLPETETTTIVTTPPSTETTTTTPPESKVTLCHRTDSDKNPYVTIDVDPAGAYDGHYSEHNGPVWNPTLKKQHVEWGDIIPPFTYNDAVWSQNWTVEGMAIYNNGCDIPGGGSTPPPSSETTTPPATETTTPPDTETTTPPDTETTTPPDTETTTPPDTDTSTVTDTTPPETVTTTPPDTDTSTITETTTPPESSDSSSDDSSAPGSSSDAATSSGLAVAGVSSSRAGGMADNAGPAVANDSALAVTGSPSSMLLMLGLVLLLGGLLLAGTASRWRPQRHH